MKTFSQKIVAAGVGVFLTANMAVYGTTLLYDNSTTDTGNSLNFVNGWTIGNQIIMGNPSPLNTLTFFSFEIYSTEAAFIGSPQMEVFLYQNDGPLSSGVPAPGTPLYDSGLFSFSTPLQVTAGNSLASTIQVDLSATPLTVPHEFTLAVFVSGLNALDSAGVELFDPATVGQNYGDYWLNSGSGWGLYTNTASTDFGARFEGTSTPAPDAAPTAMLLGAALSSLGFLRRKLS
jgi:hypothetical protein